MHRVSLHSFTFITYSIIGDSRRERSSEASGASDCAHLTHNCMHYIHCVLYHRLIHRIIFSFRTSHRNAVSRNFTRGNDSRAKSTREEVRSESDRTSRSYDRPIGYIALDDGTHGWSRYLTANARHPQSALPTGLARAREIYSRFESATGAKVKT